LRIGLNRKLDWPGTFQPGEWPSESPVGGDRWEVHAQMTYLPQGFLPIRALYSGPNSLPAAGQDRATWSTSAFIGMRLWDGGEFYFTPELFQGFGLGGTTGLGGFSNGEAQKSNFPYPRLTPTRAFLRETFGFGGEQEMLDGGPQQLSGKADISRLTVQVGKFAVVDVFDGNAYAKDPRKDFMNWSIWGPGAFDYAADKVGLTYGATAELNQKNWAFRAGYFLMDAESNSNDMDMHLFSRGEYVAELEGRYSLFSQPGKVRLLGFLNSVFSGSYIETLNDPALNMDISQTRESRIKYGYGLNFEQAVSDDIGLFGRWNWNDGHNEIMAFTDIDRSLSFGTSIKGTAWGRKDDTLGLGAAFNGLSQDHRAFLAAGGLGVLVGDGALNYGTEKILETYYACSLVKGTTVTFDYQYVTNPAFNRDRGPASILSGRFHVEF
jgi:high affinity Mn2+ porin